MTGPFVKDLPAMPPPHQWELKANCVQIHPGVFFPERGESPVHAQKICKNCEVKAECLDFALRWNIKHGVWGGESERARRRIRRERRLHLEVA
jgi:WhiB family redox-sensing transcriptional regulator